MSMKLQKLTTQQVQSLYSKKLKEGLSSERVRTIHAVLHKALDHAKRIKLVAINVCDDVEELPRQAQHEIQPLTPEQAQMLLQKIHEHNLEALLTLALTTGMRKGEILALRWQDIDLQKNTLQIRHTVNYRGRGKFLEGEPKTEKSKRKIILPQFVVEALKSHRTMQLETRLQVGSAWVDNDLVFSNKHGGFMVPLTLSRHFEKLLEEASLPRIRFHDLRHSAATLLLSEGVHPKVVQELLGHSQISMTIDVYSHALPSMQQDAISRLNDTLENHKDDVGRRDVQ